MDADTRLALDIAADEALCESQTQASRDRALEMKRLLTDGVCRITDVKESFDLPCRGIIWTDLGERFPVFTTGDLEAARWNVGKRVKLHIRTSAVGTRWVDGMARLPETAKSDGWPCLNCWQVLAQRSDDGTRYVCPRCHYQMEVGA